MNEVRVGIIGTGMIAKLFAGDAKLVDNCKVVAVSSRSKEKGNAFAKAFDIGKVYTSYEKMLEDKDIDMIYIATPHVKHKENTLAALKMKKAVLCEKPFAMNSEDAAEMIVCAKEEGVLLMEAMWTRYLPAIKKMKRLIKEGAIGDVLFVKSDFGFNVGPDYPKTGRLLNPELGGGALFDVGIYTVSMVMHIFEKSPVEILCTKMLANTGVDAMSTYSFQFDQEELAILYSAVCVETQKEVFISGTKGTIHIPNFWKANQITVTNILGETEVFKYENLGEGYAYEIKDFCDTYLDGKTENKIMPLKETLSIMKVIDEIKTKIAY